jgi:hypothetical protein
MRDFVAMNAPRVMLTGDRAGAYVVVEERADGRLVLAPDPAARSSARTTGARPTPPGHRPSANAGTSLSELLSGHRRRGPATVHEALDEWGVALHVDEFVVEFTIADVDGANGFIAITNQRLIFLARAGSGLRVADEHRLSADRGVALVRRGLTRKLRVSWEGQETTIGAPDRRTLARLRRHLTPR